MIQIFISLIFISLIFIPSIFANAQLILPIVKSHEQNKELVKGNTKMNNFEKLVTPSNVSDFVHNVKHCIDQDCLLRNDFFTEENLIAFANGKTLENFGEKKQHFVVHNINIQGISLAVGFSRENTLTQESGNLVANFDDHSLNVDSIIELFGTPTKIENLYRNVLPTHLPDLDSKTHNYGHSEILQTIIGINSTTKITTFTLKDGTIFKLNVKQFREKK